MDKKEILNLLDNKSERIQVVKDPKYETTFPDQCYYLEVDDKKTRFYKCSLCVGMKSLITCGDRNTKDSIKKHHDRAHGVNLFTIGAKRTKLFESEPSDQKKLKSTTSRFQIGQLDTEGKHEFQQAIAVWQARSDIPYNALQNTEFNNIFRSFAGTYMIRYHIIYDILT